MIMKNIIAQLLVIVMFAACGSNGKKQETKNYSPHKYIYVVESVEGYDVAYTEDGHTLIYSNDSVGDYIVYYAKFDDNAGKHGYDRVKEKAVRAEMDSSLKTLKSISSIYGGAFCKRNDNTGYAAFYFDEQMKGNSIDQIAVPLGDTQSEETSKEQEIKHILSLLNIAYILAQSINNNNASGWNNMALALESVQGIITYDVIKNDTVYDTIIKAHISKLAHSTEGLTQFYNVLWENYNSQNSNTKL